MPVTSDELLITPEAGQHTVFDVQDPDCLGTDIFLSVNIPSFTDAIKPCPERRKGFGGAERDGFGYYLTDGPGWDSPAHFYDVPPVMPLPKSPFTSLMSEPPGKQYKISGRTLVSRMGRDAITSDKRDMEISAKCYQAPGRYHREIPIGTRFPTYRAPTTFAFDKSPRLPLAEYIERVKGRSDAPPSNHYTPHLVNGPPLFSTLLERQDWVRQHFSAKHYQRPRRLKDRTFGWAERFPFRYPVPNDCSSVYKCEVKRAPEAKAAAPATTNRSMSRAKRRTSLTNHAVDDCPPPGAYDLPSPYQPTTKNVREGYSPALPGGRGAIVRRVIEKRNQTTGETRFALDMEDDAEAKAYHRKVERLARAKKAEGGVTDEDRQRMTARLQELKARVFGKKDSATVYPPMPPHTAPAKAMGSSGRGGPAAA